MLAAFGGVEASAAPARRRRVARAAHSADQPAHQHRSARRDCNLPRGAAGCCSDVVEQLGEMSTLIWELIELGHAERHVAEPEDVRLDLLARTPSIGRSATAPGSSSPRISRRAACRACRRRSSGRSRTCSTTQRSGARRVARWRSGYARAGDRSGPRSGHRGRGSAVRLRPVLPRSGGTRDARIRARARDRPTGRRRARRRRRRGARRRRRHAHDAAPRSPSISAARRLRIEQCVRRRSS